MAIVNPNLEDGFDLNGSNLLALSTALKDDGYSTSEIPKSGHINTMYKEIYRYMQFLKSTGVSQWDNTVSYQKFSRIMRDGVIYSSLSDANQGNDPLLGLVFWETREVLNTAEVQASLPIDWDGKIYIDPDAVGANPSALIFPNGVIKGSTDNGKYIKFPDGKLFCWGESTTTITTDQAHANLFRGASPKAFIFPVIFIGDLPSVQPSTINSVNTWAQITGAQTLNSVPINLYGGLSISDGKPAYFAQGEW